MAFFDIVKKSLAMYRMNPILIFPPLVAMVFQLISSLVIVSPSFSFTSQGFSPEVMVLIFAAFGVFILNIVVSFLVLLGQVIMTGKVIQEGKTRLNDWGKGFKKYFLRTLGINLIYYGIVSVLFILVMIVLMLALLPQLISQLSGTVSLGMPQISPLILMSMSFVTVLLTTVASAIFYMWLAPVVLDDKGVSASLKAGTEVIGRRRNMFLGFVVFFFLMNSVSNLLTGTSLTLFTYPVTMVQSMNVGYITQIRVVSQVITTIFSPIWFLIAFAIYSEQKTVT